MAVSKVGARMRPWLTFPARARALGLDNSGARAILAGHELKH
jgi:hypothetical protein